MMKFNLFSVQIFYVRQVNNRHCNPFSVKVQVAIPARGRTARTRNVSGVFFYEKKSI